MDELERLEPKERERLRQRLERLREGLSTVRDAAEGEEPMFDPGEDS